MGGWFCFVFSVCKGTERKDGEKNGQSSSKAKYETHCFKTLIWGQNRSPFFYNFEERFGWNKDIESQIWYYHYYVLLKYGISFDNFEEMVTYPQFYKCKDYHNNNCIVSSEEDSRDLLTLDKVNQLFDISKRPLSWNHNNNNKNQNKKPKLLWITRDTGRRRMGNLNDVVTYFKLKGFDVITCCDWDSIHSQLINNGTKRFETLHNMISTFHSADIMIGLHGAGLANAIYMKPGSVLIELRVPYGFSWGSFANIASQMGLSYYSGDVRRFCEPLCLFSKKYLKRLANEIYDRFLNEKLFGKESSYNYELKTKDNFCLLPMPKRFDDELNENFKNYDILTKFNESHCYHNDLESAPKNDELKRKAYKPGIKGKQWFQLFDHFDYLAPQNKFIYQTQIPRTRKNYGTFLDPENTQL